MVVAEDPPVTAMPNLVIAVLSVAVEGPEITKLLKSRRS